MDSQDLYLRYPSYPESSVVVGHIEWSTYNYLARCIELGWGIDYASRDWTEGRLNQEDKQSLINLEKARHLGYKR